MGKGLHLGGVDVAGDVLGLVLLGKDHRATKKLRSHTRDPDPRCLDGQNLGDSAVAKQAVKFLANLLEEGHIHLVVEKTVYLEYVSALDLAVFSDAFFQKFHAATPPSL